MAVSPVTCITEWFEIMGPDMHNPKFSFFVSPRFNPAFTMGRERLFRVGLGVFGGLMRRRHSALAYMIRHLKPDSVLKSSEKIHKESPD